MTDACGPRTYTGGNTENANKYRYLNPKLRSTSVVLKASNVEVLGVETG